MLGALEVEIGDVEVCVDELGGDEDCAGDVLEVDVLGAGGLELAGLELAGLELGGLELGGLELGGLELGEGQLVVGKNRPRAEPPACASTCTKHSPATA